MKNSTLYVHILCNRDERSPEDIAIEKQFAELQLPLRKPEDDEEEKVKQEWRPGVLNYSNIEGFYAHTNNTNTLVHTISGGVLTIKESVMELIGQIKKLNNTLTSAEIYNYTARLPDPINPDSDAG